MWPDNRIARDAHYLYRYDRHGRLTEKTDLIPEGVIRTDDEAVLFTPMPLPTQRMGWTQGGALSLTNKTQQTPKR
ncbi:hypothetical protein UP87_27315, partial [Escherichia coli]